MTGQREGWGHCWNACLTAEQCSHHISLGGDPWLQSLIWRWKQRDLKVEFKASVEYTGLCLENE